ncbi:bifunctional UDP-sugar hydrolase/5'-nucleotidase [uncultured Cetobacterium sp.]|uniref:bifunctional metallophosphatase/5'-nucleotidase n=1 Tax=uncultured Cetobacterium sp. TaxID=527638 RepID=UPI002635FE1C|nr:bifunctional UDP-sugar hydrolase/5'-nucleotidase [uncultured Cetobacterium sp.]
MKQSAKILGLMSLILGLSACSVLEPKDGEYELTLVHVNDIHGRVKEGKYDGVGLARVATIAKALKQDKNNGNVLLLDAGDTLHGTTFATLTKGESMVEVLNASGFDYMTLGNHDFNYGTERLKELISLGKYKTLAANVIDKRTGSPLATSYDIKKIDGKKVGFFGLSTPETYYKTNPKNVENIKFVDPIKTAKQIVSEMKKKGVKFIVVITHLGEDSSTEKRYQSIGLAEAVPGIDLIIDGHSHTELAEKKVVNGVTIVQTGEYAKNVGVVKVDLDKLKNKNEAIDYTLYTKDIILKGDNPVQEDILVKSKIDEISKKQEMITSVKVGESSVLLQGNRAFVRTGETNLSQLITDSMIWKTGADVAITNGGGIRASINPGEVTVGDVISVLPFGNYVITKEITGENLQKAIEHGLRSYPESLGGMAQIAGMTVKFNIKNPEYRRVLEIKIGAERLDPTKKYIIATNDFMAAGGDGYSSLSKGKEVGHFGGLDEVLIEYIQKEGIQNREKIKPRLIPIK